MTNQAHSLQGVTYIAPDGEHAGQVLTVTGKDFMFPDQDLWLAMTPDKTFETISGSRIREIIGQGQKRSHPINFGDCPYGYWSDRAEKLTPGVKVALWNVYGQTFVKWYEVEEVVTIHAIWIKAIQDTPADSNDWRHLVNAQKSYCAHASDIYTEEEVKEIEG